MNRDATAREVVGTAWIGVAGQAGEMVLARVTIPNKRSEHPRITLKPTSKQFTSLQYFLNGTLSLRMELESDAQSCIVESTELWMLEGAQTYWSQEVQECTFEIDPRGFSIKEIRHGDRDAGPHVSANFWVSPNKFLHPFTSVRADHRGNRAVNVLHETNAVLVGGHKLIFAKNFHWWSDERAAVIGDYQLGAFCEGPARTLKEFYLISESIVAEIDDYLLVVSLATRTRTSCFGWDASCDEGIWSSYLPDKSIPTGYAASSLNDGLIDRADHGVFFQRGYDNLTASPYKVALRAAVFALVPLSQRNLESDFIAVFSALEELLLQFRRLFEMEYALGDDQWREVKKKIKCAIREVVSDKSARNKLYRKLDELNRISISDAFGCFVTKIELDHSDLWPVFDGSEGASLYKVRNWLSHGEHIPRSAQDYLWVALEHLRWTLERIVLLLLEWPIERSEVRPALLKRHATAMREFEVARTCISNAMAIS